MNRDRVEALVDAWRRAGMKPPSESSFATVLGPNDDLPWYVRLFAAAGALFASSLFLGFLYSANVINTPTGSLFVGALLLGGAAAASWMRPSGPMAESILPAALLPGQVLLFMGFADLVKDSALLGLFGMFVSVGLLLCRNQLQRLVSVLSFFGFAMLFSFNYGPRESVYVWTALAGALLPLFYLSQERWNHLPDAGGYSGPVAAGLALALVSLNVACSFTGSVALRGRWIPALAMALVLLPFIWYALRERLGLSIAATLAFCFGIAAVLAPTYQNPGVSGALLVLVVGFAFRVRLVAVLGALSLVGFLGFYYYSLELTLLQKSVALMGSGALFLLAAAGLGLLHKEGRA